MILKILMIIIFLGIVPELLGLLILNFWEKEKNNLLLAFILGYIMEFAISQLISVPMIFMQTSYTALFKLYTIIILLICLISAIIIFKRNNKEKLKEYISKIKTELKEYPKILAIICIILFGIQIYMYVGSYTHLDDDDAYYVGTATTTIQTNTIYRFSPTTGSLNGEQNVLRYRLGAFPLYYAFVSSYTRIHPAIVAHIILPIPFMIVAYGIYYLIGYELFEKKHKSALLFVLIMSIINIYGNYSIRTTFSFLLFRIWQGKAVLCNIILPLLIYLFFKANEEKFKIIICLIMLVTILGGIFTTTMGIALPPMMVGLLAILYGVQNKSFKDVIKCFICCLPAVVYGLLYIIL